MSTFKHSQNAINDAKGGIMYACMQANEFWKGKRCHAIFILSIVRWKCVRWNGLRNIALPVKAIEIERDNAKQKMENIERWRMKRMKGNDHDSTETAHAHAHIHYKSFYHQWQWHEIGFDFLHIKHKFHPCWRCVVLSFCFCFSHHLFF